MSFSSCTSSKQGFTLIELAIVLTIVGLIAGGIIGGQSVIKNAAMQREISNVTKINSAINVFETKFGCLPGDCINATSLIAGVANNGDGDGKIEVNSMDVPGAIEGQFVFIHLVAANLFSGDYSITSCKPGVGYPVSKMHDDTGFFLFAAISTGTNSNGTLPYIGDRGHWLRTITGSTANCWNSTQTAGQQWAYSPVSLFSIDSKIDDGKPYTGTVRLMAYDYFSQATSLQSVCKDSYAYCGGLAGVACSAAGAYATGDTSRGCPAAFGLSF